MHRGGAVADFEARPLRRDLRRLPPRPLQRAAGHAGHHRAGQTARLSTAGAGHVRRGSPSSRGTREGPGQGQAAVAARHVEPPGRRGAGDLLPVPLRQAASCSRSPVRTRSAGPTASTAPPATIRTGRSQEIAEGPVPAVPHRTRRRWPGTRRSTTINGVACTDCHNPHPGSVRAAVREHQPLRASSGPSGCRCRCNEPEACYKCHPKIYGLNALPSHHPIKEGKMVCSDCHDPHGQDDGEPQGGDHQPAVLQVPRGEAGAVRLRAPAGARELRDLPQAARRGGQQPAAAAGDVPLPAVPSRPPRRATRREARRRAPASSASTPIASLRRPFYTNCTQCHQQIHGTNRHLATRRRQFLYTISGPTERLLPRNSC